MKFEYKSMFLGIILGIVGILSILFFLGDVETKLSISTPEHANKMDKNIDIRIKKTVENGQNLTHIYLNGDGDITKEDIDRELDRLLKEYDIDKNDSTINFEMEINR